MKQLTKAKAQKMYDDKEWKDWSDKQIVDFQLYQKKLCMEWTVFHGAVERILGRPVYTYEFSQPDKLKAEYEAK